MKQPLLIAWRPRSIGFWILFDPGIAQPVDDESVAVDFGLAIQNDLMSVLAGAGWGGPFGRRAGGPCQTVSANTGNARRGEALIER